METKLTLRMDERIIKAAKRYARKRGTSLSRLVADYLEMISSKNTPSEDAPTFEMTPILSEISGVLRKTSSKKDVRNEYRKHLEKKYL